MNTNGYIPIADAVHCASKGEVRADKTRIMYGRGILVGLVAGLMADGVTTFDEACSKIIDASQQGICEGGRSHMISPLCVPNVHFWEGLISIIDHIGGEK